MDSSSSLTQILLSASYPSEAADGVYSDTGTQTKYYYGNGLAAQSDSLNGYLTYHFDHLGSTTALTNCSGKTVSHYAYGTYGERTQGDTNLTHFLYNGQYGVITDSNGLYQMRARYYSSDLKRFVNQDVLLGAITDSQSLNRYAYTNGNPMNRLDPFGLCAAMIKNLGHLVLNLLSTMLLFTPCALLGAVLAGINAAWYFYDGDILGGLCSLGIVLGGVGGLIGGTAGLIMSGCGELLMAGTSTWSAGQSIGKMHMDYQETGKINPWDAVNATMNLGMAAMGAFAAAKSFASIPALGRINSKLESALNANKIITKLKYKPTSGAILKATPNKTTTIIGGYEKDMKYIVNEMGNVKSTDFGARNGGFNVLNVPDKLYVKETFWELHNKPWLDEVIKRGDDIIVATKPDSKFLSYIDNSTGKEMLTGFGKEIEYLAAKGYVYDPISSMMRLS